MTEPTDAEIIALADETRTAEGGASGYILPISFARAVLAKWGTPQPSPVGPPAPRVEPVAWLNPWRADQVTTDYDAYGRHGIPLYTAPQPVARETLTCEWTHNEDDGFWGTECGQSWRFDDGGPKENNMNFCHCCGKPLRIKGGQHGAE